MIGSWIVCTVMLLANDGETVPFEMRGQLMLEASDGITLYVDFSGALDYYNFKTKPNQPMTVPMKECNHMSSRREKEFPENDG